ncbi:MAG: spore coat protein [Clostridiales bacterium]|nr:spore coat protein [Clostridiales bacterium]
MAQLSSKELSAIEDQLSAEKLLVSKFKAYAQTCQDPQLKAKCEQLAAKHQSHYDRLYSCLN